MKTYTIYQFREAFSNDNICLDTIFNLRYGKLTGCPVCNKPFHYTRVTTISKKDKDQRKCYQCAHCRNQIYPLVGTIYEKSRTPLTYWFYAIYLYTVTRNGVAAKELERQLGVTYKCAFRMSHKIRQLTSVKRDCFLDGVLAIDESWIGGKIGNKHKHERVMLRPSGDIHKNKIFVLGIMQEGKLVEAMVIDSLTANDILPQIIERVHPGSTIVTDSAESYRQLSELGYEHVVVNHDKGEWVNGDLTTNSIEGFWSQLKRTIKGTHIKVSKKYLQKYVDECCFRYEYSKKPMEMFDVLLKKLA